MKSTAYLDYNSTSPLASSVTEYLARGDFLFANPSSRHFLGKEARKQINEVTSFLRNHFSLDDSFDVVFNSGATESINSWIENISQENSAVFYFEADHAAVLESVERATKRGVEAIRLDVDKSGHFNLDQVVTKINSSSHKVKWLNFTWANNETGVIWDILDAVKIKESTGCLVHVDAVQTVGKMQGYQKLSTEIDWYSYSAHKFGAFKNLGFSFIKKKLKAKALIVGGSQQQGLRSGTENPLGIMTIKLALNELLEKQNLDEVSRTKEDFEKSLLKILADKGEVVSLKSKRLLNTTNIVVYGQKSDSLLMHFDLAGLALSSGSACSAQTSSGSKVLESMGLKEYAKSTVRISFDPVKGISGEVSKKFFSVLENILR